MKVWLKVLVSVGLLALLAWVLPWHQVEAAIARLSAGTWALVLLGFVLPNFYFHVTTAYAILRHNGIELGKKDFLIG